MTSAAFVRAALAGAASGSRSMSAVAACALSGPPGPGRIDAWLHRPRGRRVHVLAAAGELVGDKLPQAPARTEPPALAARLVLGAAAASVLAGRRGESVGRAVLIAAAAAAATTFGGPPVRAALARRSGRDLPGAVAEDVLALGMATVAVRLP